MDYQQKCSEAIRDIEKMLVNKHELKPQDIEKLRNLPALIMKVAVNDERITFQTTVARGRTVRSVSFKEATLTYFKQNDKDTPVLQRIVIKGGYHSV